MKLLLDYVNEAIERDEQRIERWRMVEENEYADGMSVVLTQMKFVRKQLEELTQQQTQTTVTHAINNVLI